MTDGYLTITGAITTIGTTTSLEPVYVTPTIISNHTSGYSTDWWEQRNQRISDDVTRRLQRENDREMDYKAINDALLEAKYQQRKKEGFMAFGLCEGGTKCHLCGSPMRLREQEAETIYRDDGSIKFDSITNRVTYKCNTTVEKSTEQEFKKNKDTEPCVTTKTFVGDGCIKVKEG